MKQVCTASKSGGIGGCSPPPPPPKVANKVCMSALAFKGAAGMRVFSSMLRAVRGMKVFYSITATEG